MWKSLGMTSWLYRGYQITSIQTLRSVPASDWLYADAHCRDEIVFSILRRFFLLAWQSVCSVQKYFSELTMVPLSMKSTLNTSLWIPKYCCHEFPGWHSLNFYWRKAIERKGLHKKIAEPWPFKRCK